jgi:hypothetical protein
MLQLTTKHSGDIEKDLGCGEATFHGFINIVRLLRFVRFRA